MKKVKGIYPYDADLSQGHQNVPLRVKIVALTAKRAKIPTAALFPSSTHKFNPRKSRYGA